MEEEKNTSPERLNIDNGQATSLDPTIQKYILDENPYRRNFYAALCGHRIVYETTTTIVLGKEISETREKLEIDIEGRILNEAGANYAFNAIAEFISAGVGTSKINEEKIYYAYRARVRNIRFDLAKSFLRGNPYQLKAWRLSAVSTMLMGLYLNTSKADGGFAMKQLSENIMTATIIRGGGQVEKKEGILDKMKAGFSNAKG